MITHHLWMLYCNLQVFFVLKLQTCSQVLTVRVQVQVLASQVQVQVLASQVQVQVLNLRVQVRDSMSQPVFLVISKKFQL